jgi:hypothetical protein
MDFEPSRCFVAVLLVAAVAAVTPLASAQSAADRETARALMKQGDTAFDAADYSAALEAYETAHGIMQVPSTGVALARAQEKLGLLLEARNSVLAVARMPARPNEPAAFTEARAAADDLAETLEARIPSLSVDVRGSEQVRVAIDGAELPRAQFRVRRKLNPGRYTVVASAPGFREAREEVVLAESQARELELELEPSTGPITETWSDPGKASAVAVRDDAPRGSRLSPLVYVGFGVGAAGIAVGSVAGVMSLSKTSSARERCVEDRCSPAASDDIDAARTLATVSNIGFGIGVAGAAVGVYALLTSNRERPAQKARRVEPLVGARFVGVRGAF